MFCSMLPTKARNRADAVNARFLIRAGATPPESNAYISPRKEVKAVLIVACVAAGDEKLRAIRSCCLSVELVLGNSRIVILLRLEFEYDEPLLSLCDEQIEPFPAADDVLPVKFKRLSAR